MRWPSAARALLPCAGSSAAITLSGTLARRCSTSAFRLSAIVWWVTGLVPDDGPDAVWQPASSAVQAQATAQEESGAMEGTGMGFTFWVTRR